MFAALRETAAYTSLRRVGGPGPFHRLGRALGPRVAVSDRIAALPGACTARSRPGTSICSPSAKDDTSAIGIIRPPPRRRREKVVR